MNLAVVTSDQAGVDIARVRLTGLMLKVADEGNTLAEMIIKVEIPGVN